MTKPLGMERSSKLKIRVLSIGPREEDHAALSQIFADAQWPLCPDSEWTLESCPTLGSAITALKSRQAPLVICESDLGAATWRDFWTQAASLPDPPFLIVTSRLADEYLWAEALNLGAYDVLAKPFQADEVVRALSQAWLHRNYRHAPKPSRTAGPQERPTRTNVAV
ncbi:MAG TPA: response regulator [Bryobacteraceae bacterium]|nr:response regulator [Bryobacteraceae bacterium]